MFEGNGPKIPTRPDGSVPEMLCPVGVQNGQTGPTNPAAQQYNLDTVDFAILFPTDARVPMNDKPASTQE